MMELKTVRYFKNIQRNQTIPYLKVVSARVEFLFNFSVNSVISVAKLDAGI